MIDWLNDDVKTIEKKFASIDKEKRQRDIKECKGCDFMKDLGLGTTCPEHAPEFAILYATE